MVCRYGVPVAVRADRGREFAGEFAAYLESIGTVLSVVSTAHPRANGQVERYNAFIKAGFRRMMTACPGTCWFEHLGDVLMGLRLLPTRLGFSLYLLVYKQDPAYISNGGSKPGVSSTADVEDLS